jgi:hypothetical protein
LLFQWKTRTVRAAPFSNFVQNHHMYENVPRGLNYQKKMREKLSFLILDALGLKFWGTLIKVFSPTKDRYYMNTQKINNSEIFFDLLR